jgi:SUKH-4 immunity protein
MEECLHRPPRFVPAVFSIHESIPKEVLDVLARTEVPKCFVGARYFATPDLSWVDGPGGERLVRFGRMPAFVEGWMCIDPESGHVLEIMDPEHPVLRLANSSIGHFSDCVRGVIDLFPYYHREDYDDFEAVGEKIAARLNDIDPAALSDKDGFWRTFVDDVQIGDFSVEEVMS